MTSQWHYINNLFFRTDQHADCCKIGTGNSYIMMTSSNGHISALLSLCAGNSPVTGEFLAQRPVTRSFDVFFNLCLNKRLSKQSWGWWFEAPSRPLRRHCNVPIEFRAWMNNDGYIKLWNMIIYLCPKINGDLAKPSVKLGYGWTICL